MLRIFVGAVVALLLVAVVALVALGVPRHAAGMAARSVCSAVFVAGRAADRVFEEDVRPASAALALVTVDVDRGGRHVVGRFGGGFARRARHLGERGCVLDAADDARSVDAPPLPPTRHAPWPEGNTPLAPPQWGPGIDAARLASIVEAAFADAGDPRGTNTRAVTVVHHNRLLVDRHAPGFAADTPLHGWSMTKTVLGMLAHAIEGRDGFASSARVVDMVGATGAAGEPSWAAAWRGDARAAIRIEDLMWMRDGLANEESYAPWGAVPRMLFGDGDVAGHAAAARSEAAPGSRWRYSSGATNILASVVRARVDDGGQGAWTWPRRTLFEPIGAHSAVLETDAAGTWIASSYLWAASADWARLGQLLLDDGRWQGRQVLPPGFLTRASTPAMAHGEGRGYGAQTWLIGAREPGEAAPAGKCAGRVPPDTLAMRGHWGQIVAVVPSRRAVIVRLGWTFDVTRFDACRFVADVLGALGSGEASR
jgi:hypothetical protein